MAVDNVELCEHKSFKAILRKMENLGARTAASMTRFQFPSGIEVNKLFLKLGMLLKPEFFKRAFLSVVVVVVVVIVVVAVVTS